MNHYSPCIFQLRSRIKILVMVIVACLFSAHANDRENSRDQRMETWREGRFGMFIHWGPYSVAAGAHQGKAVPLVWNRLSPCNGNDDYHEFDDPQLKGIPAHSWNDSYLKYLRNNPSVLKGAADCMPE